MPSIPLTPSEEKQILSQLQLQSLDDLFVSVPPQIRKNADFKLDFGPGYENKTEKGLTEHELRLYFHKLASKNAHFPDYRHFLGGGIYDNIVPAIVNQLVLRGEFLTCYTPYQPEISQGTLQAIFEFQTMIARITGMQVSNASMYDGSTATTEAVLMAQRLAGKNSKRILIAESLHPQYQKVCETFLSNHSEKPISVPFDAQGKLDTEALKKLITEFKPCGIVVGYPNYFGVVENLDKIKSLLPEGCLLIASVPDLSSLSIFESPGKLGADIVVGEAHSLGTPMLFGGPHVGIFATRKEFLRQMPGRLCGESVDSRGQRVYTLTLSTREQHIRRDKATSNICTNQGLIALRTVIYLSFLGKQGFINLGETNHSLFEYLAQGLETHGIPLLYKKSQHYREGVFDVPHLKARMAKAIQKKLVPGIPLSKYYPNHKEFSNSLLICVNPKHSKKDLDDLIEVLSHD